MSATGGEGERKNKNEEKQKKNENNCYRQRPSVGGRVARKGAVVDGKGRGGVVDRAAAVGSAESEKEEERKREESEGETVEKKKKSSSRVAKARKLFLKKKKKKKKNSRVGVERDVLDAQRREHQQRAPAEEAGPVAADDAVGERDVASAVLRYFLFCEKKKLRSFFVLFSFRRKTLQKKQKQKSFSPPPSLRNDRQPAAVHPGEAVLDHKVLDRAEAPRGGVDSPNGTKVEAAFFEFC